MSIFNQPNKIKGHRGFTLIELLVVVAVITLLVTIALASLNVAREKSKVAAAHSQLKQIKIGLQLMLDTEGVYPNGADTNLCDNGNEATLTSSSNVWNYIQYTQDPWGNDYIIDGDYQCGSATTGCNNTNDAGAISGVILSMGPNGVEDYGDSDDIVFVECKR